MHSSETTRYLAEISLDARQQAIEHLNIAGFPEVHILPTYYEQRHGWVRWLLERKGPFTDWRFAQREGESIDPYKNKNHQPADILSPVFSGESSSWNFRTTRFLTKLWQSYRQRVSETILKSAESDYDASFERIRGEIRKDFWQVFNSYGAFLREQGADFSHRQRVTVAGSGADAIRVAYDLTCSSLPPELVAGSAATTTENGSGVYELPLGEDKKGLVALRSDLDIENTNQEISDQELVEFYTRQIDQGVSFISLTLASKTGVRYDISHTSEPSVMEQVLAYAAEKNAQVQPVVIILDAVQLVGRVPFAQVLSYLEKPGVSGLVHTGSKGPGGAPHAGCIIWSEMGRQQVTDNTSKLSPAQRQQVVQNLRSREVVYSPYAMLPESNRQWDVMASLRAMDNMVAVGEAEKILAHSSYAETVAAINDFYTQIFHTAGFRILSNDLPNIIAMEPPDGLRSETHAHAFLGHIAEQGIAFGGFLKENHYPIFRWGIAIDLIHLVQQQEISLTEYQDQLVQALASAKAAVLSQ
ncbi:MAG TPA: hypothetical protein VF209_01695 [Patescibacteria group bacterium]